MLFNNLLCRNADSFVEFIDHTLHLLRYPGVDATAAAVNGGTGGGAVGSALVHHWGSDIRWACDGRLGHEVFARAHAQVLHTGCS